MKRWLILAALTSGTLVGLHPDLAMAQGESAEQRRAAQKMFEAGDELYESGRYAEAVEAFRNSYQLVKSPNSRLMLARALRDQGQHEEAIREYEGTIQDAKDSGGRYPEALGAATAELEAISQQTTSTPPPTGESKSPETAATQPTPPPAPAPTPVAAPPQPPPEKSKAWRTAAYVSGGVGVAGLAAFGVFALLNRSAYQDLKDSCPDDSCPESKADRIDIGQRYQLFANVGLAVGVLGLATGTTLYFVAPDESPSQDSLALSAGFEGVVLSGRF